MSSDRVVTACFCSWGRHSGYIQIPVRDVVDGGFDVLNGERYFGVSADVGEHKVVVSNSDADRQAAEFLVFFDRNLHSNGTQCCPYLAVKVVEGERAADLMRSDYVAAVVAIEEILCVVPPSQIAQDYVKSKTAIHE
ncbi:hypothetical protein C8R48DRAFT_774705 [Suillus tomentosus]|nr:hypothetical protein C8R48DRAFT_774705 [Suillus tomentosus]